MGVRVQVTGYAPSAEAGEKATVAAFARFGELDAIFSDYRRDSEAMRLCAAAQPGRPQVAGEELFRVLERAQEIARLSDGAFDVTCGPLVRLWREARKAAQLPTPEQVAAARAATGWRNMRLTPGARLVTFDQPGMTLDFGGIVKGYACDQALAVLRRHGVTRALVEAGGDMAASGPPPGEKGWRVRILGLEPRLIFLAHQALSTSGDAAQFVEIGGVRYSHIVDPRTGIGLTNRRQVSILAREGLMSDPLATALCVMDPEAGRALARRYGARAIYR